MSLTVLEADYMVPWSYDFRNAPDQQQVLIAAKGVTENDRVGFGPHAEKRDGNLRDFRSRVS